MIDSGSAMAELKAEFVHGLPLETAWKMAKRSDMILPSVLPHVFAKVERLEGDGGVGTIRIVTLGDGVPGAGQTFKERVDVFDKATHTIEYTTIEGGDPRFTHTKFTIKFTPGKNSDSETLVTWTCEYIPVDETVAPPEELKAFSDDGYRALEKYVKEHPETAAD